MAWSGAGFQVTFERYYNEERKAWEVAQYFFFETKPFLNPGESVQFERKLYTEVPVGAIQGTFRIKVKYLDHEHCKYPDYIKNAEVSAFCYKQIRTVYSNEFIVKGPIVEAFKFCYERKKRQNGYFPSFIEVLPPATPRGGGGGYVGPSFYFNFDIDQDREIIGLCEPDGWGGYMVLFVLDKQNEKYEPVLVKDRGDAFVKRYYKFANLRIRDIDKDGIDEIIFEERGWYGGGGVFYLHLYSPKHQEWFYGNNWWQEDIITGIRKEGVEFSPNLDLEKYKVFKEFFLEYFKKSFWEQ